MSDREFYSYELDVKGTPEEQVEVYNLLEDCGVFDDEILEPCGPKDAPYSHYKCPPDENDRRWTYEWNETDQETLLHDIAVKVPGATIEIYGDCETDQSYGYHKRFHGDMYQESHTVTHIPPLKEGADVPFAERYFKKPVIEETSSKANAALDLLADLQKRARSADRDRDSYIEDERFPAQREIDHIIDELVSLDLEKFAADTKEAPKKAEGEKVYLLCEEHEGEDAIREFMIHTISHDEDALKTLLRAKAERDDYGLIAKNGIDDNTDTHFKTNFENGFVEYYILEQGVLNREQVLAKLQTPEYANTFNAPKHLKHVVTSMLHDCLEEEGFLIPDLEKAGDILMADKGFQAMVKTAWWGTLPEIDYDNQGVLNPATNDVCRFIWDKLESDPDWFVKSGAAERFSYPEGLKGIVIDAIYDVSKDYQLPVRNAKTEADVIMKDIKFYTFFNELGFHNELKLADMRQVALDCCYKFLEHQYIPEEKIKGAAPGFDDLLTDAKHRAEGQSQAANNQPEKGR